MCSFSDIWDYIYEKIWPAKTEEQREKRKNKFLISNVRNKRRRIISNCVGSICTCFCALLASAVFIAVLIILFITKSQIVEEFVYKPTQLIPNYYIANSVFSPFQVFNESTKPICRALCTHSERISFHKTSVFSHENMLTINIDGLPNPFENIGGDASICFIKTSCSSLKNSTICYNLFNGNILSNETMTNQTFSISYDYYQFDSDCRELIIYDFETETPIGDFSNIQNNGTSAFNIYLVHNFAKLQFYKETIKYEEYLMLIISIFATFSMFFLCCEYMKGCCTNCIFPVRLTFQERIKCIPENSMFCCLIVFTIIGQLTFLGIFVENEIRTNFPVLSIKHIEPSFELQNQIPRYYFCDKYDKNSPKNLCCKEKDCKTLQLSPNVNPFISHRFASTHALNVTNNTKSICINTYLLGNNLLRDYSEYTCFELSLQSLNKFYIRFQSAFTPIQFLPIQRYEIFQKVSKCSGSCDTTIEFTSSSDITYRETWVPLTVSSLVPILTAFLTASIFGTLLRQVILFLYDILSPPIEFFVYRTSKIVEKGQSVKLLSDWILNYGAYLFVFICWLAYGGSSVYNFLKRPQFVKSSDILEYIQTPDFYETRVPTIGATYNHFYFNENTTIPPVSHANVFVSKSNSNYTVTDVCFNLNGTCDSTKTYQCYKLSKNQKKLFDVNYKLTPSSIQFVRPTHSSKYYQNNKINTEENKKYYCSKPTIGVRTISKIGEANYEINLEDNAEFITTKDNFGYYPSILLVLSTVSVFAYSRVFFMYLKDRIIEGIYIFITWKDVKNMKERNVELKEIIKDQKQQEKEEKLQEKYMKENEIQKSTVAMTYQIANQPVETYRTVEVVPQSRTQSVSVNQIDTLQNTNVIYRPLQNQPNLESSNVVFRPVNEETNE
eukprot:gene4012-7268_t